MLHSASLFDWPSFLTLAHPPLQLSSNGLRIFYYLEQRSDAEVSGNGSGGGSRAGSQSRKQTDGRLESTMSPPQREKEGGPKGVIIFHLFVRTRKRVVGNRLT